MYERHILRILADVGERGISIRLLSKHVYNLSCTLFFQPDLEEIHRFTRHYLMRNSRKPGMIIEHTDRRGCYRLNTRGSLAARQVATEFKEEAKSAAANDDPAPAEVHPDLSLSLFDE